MNMRKGSFIFLLLCPLLFLAMLVAFAFQEDIGTWWTGFGVLSMLSLLIWFAMNIQHIQEGLTARNLKYGTSAFLMALIVLSIQVIIEVFSFNNTTKFDLTENQRFSLAPQTKKILQDLDQEVTATAFLSEADPDRRIVENLFRDFRDVSKKFNYEIIDPDQDPVKARDYAATGRVVFFESGEMREKLTTFREERDVINALVKATREAPKKVYWVQGHGELLLDASNMQDGASQVRQQLIDENYVVEPLELARMEAVPDDADVLVIARPQNDFFDPTLNALSTWLDGGGKLLLMLEPLTTPSLETWVAKYGIDVGQNMIVDVNPLASLLGQSVLVPIVTNFESTDLTRNLIGRTVIMPTVASIQRADPVPADYTVQELLRTDQQSWAESDLDSLRSGGQPQFTSGEDIRGPVSVGAMVEFGGSINDEQTGERPRSRMVVYGDGQFASDGYIGQGNNLDLFANSIAWLAQAENTIEIRARSGGGSFISMTEQQRTLLFIVPVVVWPALMVLAGATVFVSRRKLQ